MIGCIFIYIQFSMLLISLETSSLTHILLRIMFSFQLFRDFPVTVLLMKFCQRTHFVWFQFFSVSWVLSNCSKHNQSWYMFHRNLKRMCILLLLSAEFYKCQIFRLMLLLSSVSLLIFCLLIYWLFRDDC